MPPFYLTTEEFIGLVKEIADETNPTDPKRKGHPGDVWLRLEMVGQVVAATLTWAIKEQVRTNLDVEASD